MRIGGDGVKDKDIIKQGDLQGPREFFESLAAVRIHLYTIESECDAYASDQATKALAIIDEAFDRLT